MSHFIRAAVLNQAPGTLELETVELSEPGPEQVLVRIAYAGLCHSDLHEIDGTIPTTVPILLGHEASGVVESVGSNVVGISAGDHVVTCLSVFCGMCRYCTSGRQTLCENRQKLAVGDDARLKNSSGGVVHPTAGIGAFAEKVVVHQTALAVIPTAMPLAQASILGCAITTGYGAVVHRAAVEPGSSVAVIGTGGIGMSAIQAARISGASKIIAIDVVADKLATARRFGATHTVNAREEDPVAAVQTITGAGADYAFEAVGNARTVEQAVSMLRPGGTATVVGMVPSTPSIHVDGADLFYQEKTLQGSFMGSNHFKTDIGNFVDLYLSHRLDIDSMITTILPLSEINQGFETLATGQAMRVLVEMSVR